MKKILSAILKSIAAFLNAKGGTLFIGVTEDPSAATGAIVRGLDEDLKLEKGSKDALMLKLRHLITTRIGPEFTPFIADEIKEFEGRCYWEVKVEESPAPAFVQWRAQKRFFVREGPKTSDLDTEGA